MEDSSSLPVKPNTFAQYRILVILLLINFVASAVYSIQSPFYPQEAEKKNATATEYGIVFGIYEFIFLVSCPFVPTLTRIFGEFTLFHGGIYLVSISVIIFGFLDRVCSHGLFIGLSIFLRIIEGFGESFVITTNYTFAAKLFPNNAATILAVLETMFAVGQAVGPTIGGLFYQIGESFNFAFTLPFLVLGSMLALLTVCTIPILPRIKESSDSDVKIESKFGFVTLLKIPVVRLYAFNITSTALSVGFLTATLEPHIRQFGLTQVQVGGVFLISSAVFAVTSFPWGYICDHTSKPEYIPLFGSICVLISWMFIGPLPFFNIQTSIGLVAGSLFVLGVGLGGVYVSGFLLILNGAKKSQHFEDDTSYVSCLYISSMVFGFFLGPIIGGALFQYIGFPYESLFIVVLFIVNIFLLILGTFCRGNGSENQPILTPNTNWDENRIKDNYNDNPTNQTNKARIFKNFRKPCSNRHGNIISYNSI